MVPSSLAPPARAKQKLAGVDDEHRPQNVHSPLAVTGEEYRHTIIMITALIM